MVRDAISWMFAATLLVSLGAAAQDVDVRLVIDVSGSMKTGDPEYLREDVLNGLIDMLPSGNRGGVWTFGRTTNMVVPYGVVDDAWRRAARAARGHIGSTAMRTNLGEALAAAAWDAGEPSEGRERHILLVTDGRVDLSDDASINAAQRRTITNELLPRLRAANIRLDSLALSDHSDLDFLRELANATNGYAGRADTVAEVKDYLAHTLANSTSASFGAASLGSFVIADGTDEVTLFVDHTESGFALISPTNEKIDSTSSSDTLGWQSRDGSTLTTIHSPATGTWRFSPASARLRVWSHLGVAIRPNDSAEAPSLDVALMDGDTPVDETRLGAFMTVEAELKTLYGTEPLTATPKEGGSLEYSVNLGSMPLTEDDEVTVRVVGATFERSRAYAERLAHPIDVDLRDAGDGNAGAMVQVNLPDMDVASLRVLASVRSAAGRVKLVVGSKQADGAWLIAVPALDRKVEVKLKVLFNSLKNHEIEVESDPINLDLPLPKALHLGLDAQGHMIVDPKRPAPVVDVQPDIAPDLEAQLAARSEAPMGATPTTSVDPLPQGRSPLVWEWLTMAGIAFACMTLLAWIALRSQAAPVSRTFDAALTAYRAALISAGSKPSATATT